MTPLELDVLDRTQEWHDQIDRLIGRPTIDKAAAGGELSYACQQLIKQIVASPVRDVSDLSGVVDEIREVRKRVFVICLGVPEARVAKYLDMVSS